MDGCPGGWVAVRVDAGTVEWFGGRFAELLQVQADAVGVDIPIGLPTGADRRRADLEARAVLGPQRSSVFFAPPRVVLEAASQPEATRLSRAVGSTGVSIQTFHILAKVAEVDDVLRTAPEQPAERVVEVHPEVSFRRMTDPDVPLAHLASGRTLPPKRTADGRAARLALVRGWLPDFSLPRALPGRARPDDGLDAVAAAWSAERWRRGLADVLGGDRDAAGLPMRIVV